MSGSKTGIFIRILAIVGDALMWIPILALFLITILGYLSGRIFRFDYLIPAELFPAAIIGGGLLVWVSLRVRSRQGWIIGSLSGLIAMLFGSQGIAMVTGMASGRTEPEGFWWIVILTMLGIYTILIVVLGILGVILLRDLSSKKLISLPE